MKSNKLYKGINYLFEKTEIFQNETVTVNFFSPLGKNSAADSLLINLLSDSCTKYKTNAELETTLSETCKGKISSRTAKAGDEVVLSLKLSCSSENEESFKDGVKILSECLFRPNITPDGFIEENVKKMKEKIFSSKKKTEKDDESYAENKLIEKMCENETFALSEYGTSEQLKNVSGKDLLDRWLKLMRFCPLQINYIGRFNEQIVQDIFSSLFKPLERKETWPIKTEFIPTAYEKGEYTEKIKGEKEYVCAGFRAGMSYDRDNYECSLLFSQLYSNLLNKQIKDKDIGGKADVNLNDDKGILTVICTAENGKTHEVLKAIRTALKKIQSGEFLPSKLTAAKAVLTERLQEVKNDAEKLDKHMLSFTKNSVFLTIDEITSKINQVCTEEVIVSACMTDEDTVLTFLKE